MTRLECVTETLRHALIVLAEVVPEWLLTHTDPGWLGRYGPRASDYRLLRSESKRLALVKQAGEGGHYLLSALYADETLSAFWTIPALETLRQVWLQNFAITEDQVVWRDNQTIPPARLYSGSPYAAFPRNIAAN